MQEYISEKELSKDEINKLNKWLQKNIFSKHNNLMKCPACFNNKIVKLQCEVLSNIFLFVSPLAFNILGQKKIDNKYRGIYSFCIQCSDCSYLMFFNLAHTDLSTEIG